MFASFIIYFMLTLLMQTRVIMNKLKYNYGKKS
jgi:hypothetical protein